jgi:hypothetical protein
MRVLIYLKTRAAYLKTRAAYLKHAPLILALWKLIISASALTN